MQDKINVKTLGHHTQVEICYPFMLSNFLSTQLQIDISWKIKIDIKVRNLKLMITLNFNDVSICNWMDTKLDSKMDNESQLHMIDKIK